MADAVGEADQGDAVLVTTTENMEKPPEIVYNWKDVTQEFFVAASDLQLGELLHDNNFGLFEAMSAIEMMDPKMDAGMVCNQAKRKVLNFAQATEVGKVQLETIDPSVQLAIIDDTMACLVTWLEGHSLAQTVFTNLYLHNPYVVENRPIKAFCICMLKIVDLIRERINRASVFEEEDFQPMTYGFKMAGDVTDLRTAGMLKEVEEELSRQIKHTRSKVGEERNAETEREHDMAIGIHARLKFCRLFFTTLVAFTKEKCQGIPDAQKYLTQLTELLPTISNTLSISATVPQSENPNIDGEHIMGFEPLVNQRLLPPTFPRYAQIKSRDETWTYMGGLIERLHTVCQVTEYSYLHNALLSLLERLKSSPTSVHLCKREEFFMEFSEMSPCVLSRSLLQLTFLSTNRKIFGSHNTVDVLRDTIRTFIAPPALMPKSPMLNNPQAKEYIDAFLTHASRPLCTIFQITGHNRARQRDKWGHLLEELATLQDEADKVDAYLHNLLKKVEPSRQHLACFGNWVLYHTLQCMLNYTLAGFELELYAVHEYHYIYWYLYECVYNWLISTLSRADNFLLEQDAILEQQQKGRTGKKNKKKKKSRPHLKEINMAQAAQNLCGGYYRVIVGLEIDGKLKKPKFDFDSEEVRYNHRFAPFGSVATPPPVQYGQFKEMTGLDQYEHRPTAADMYSWSCKYFQQAKTLYEGIPNPSEEVQTLIKIAKTNFIVAKLLLGGHKRDSKEPPEFEFSMHRVFPVIKLL